MTLPTHEVRIEIEAIDTSKVFVTAVRGVEELSRPFELRVELATIAATDLAAADLLGAEIAVVFSRDGEDARTIYGLVADVHDLLATPATLPAFLRDELGRAAGRCFTLRIVPRIHRLALIETQEVFVDMTLPQILRSKLEAIGLMESKDFELRLG